MKTQTQHYTLNTPCGTSTLPNVAYMLKEFAYQRPGLDPRDYGHGRDGYNCYRRESAEITRDLNDFKELYYLAVERMGIESLNQALYHRLTTNDGRLTFNVGKCRIEYCTGQYFPTEYRPAAARMLANIIWRSYMEERNANGELIYNTGHEIRTAIKNRRISRRIFTYYFN